jgi:hypothetical protein
MSREEDLLHLHLMAFYLLEHFKICPECHDQTAKKIAGQIILALAYIGSDPATRYDDKWKETFISDMVGLTARTDDCSDNCPEAKRQAKKITDFICAAIMKDDSFVYFPYFPQKSGSRTL